MLAIGIHRYDPASAPRERSFKADLKRCAFAAIDRLPNHLCPRALGLQSRIVIGAIIHHQRAQLLCANATHDIRNVGSFPKCGNDHTPIGVGGW